MRRSATFAGFPSKMITFFRALEKNNDREWFVPRKSVFDEQIRQPMIELVRLINSDLLKFAADHIVEPPEKALYRIYRDTRFSKDKTPYKTHIAANFPRQGLPRHAAAGFYFSVSHKEIEVAGGVYMPGPEELTALRDALAARGQELLKLAAERKLVRALGELQGDALRRLPKGYERFAGSPVEKLVRMKHWYWYKLLPAQWALSSRARKEIVVRFQLMLPAMQWMNEVILAMRSKGSEGEKPARPAPMW